MGSLNSHLLGMASAIAPDASLARQICRKQSRVLKDCTSTKRMYGCLAIDCQTAKISFDKGFHCENLLTLAFAACGEVSCSPNVDIEVCIMKYLFCRDKYTVFVVYLDHFSKLCS